MREWESTSYQHGQRRISEDLAQLVEELEALQGQLQSENLTAVVDQDTARLSARIADTVDSVNSSRDTILSALEELPEIEDEGERERLALEATTAVGVAEADVVALAADEDESHELDNSGTAGATTTTGGAISRFVNKTLKPILSKVATRLWNLISHLLTPKEWKVSGEISGGIPTLGMGKVTLEITFG